MKVTKNTPDLLILEFIRWEGPAFWSFTSLWCLGVIGLVAHNPGLTLTALLISLALTVGWMIPLALFLAERSMLILDAKTGEARLSHRNIRRLHQQSWPLSEVQSTRITRRYYAKGPATKDRKRLITLYVRTGMDEGRHAIANRPVRAAEALETSALISQWMKNWRKQQVLDSPPSQA